MQAEYCCEAAQGLQVVITLQASGDSTHVHILCTPDDAAMSIRVVYHQGTCICRLWASAVQAQMLTGKQHTNAADTARAQTQEEKCAENQTKTKVAELMRSTCSEGCQVKVTSNCDSFMARLVRQASTAAFSFPAPALRPMLSRRAASCICCCCTL